MTVYKQELDPGYSGPGLATNTGSENYGGTLTLPLTSKLTINARSDRRIQTEGLEIDVQELDITYQLTKLWDLSTGVRQDMFVNHSPVLTLTQDEGKRTDVVLQVGYDSGGTWRAYGFVQDTVAQDGDRPENGRVGIGGAVRISEKMTVDTEVSTGDLGPGGKLGTSYKHSERTSLYLNYS